MKNKVKNPIIPEMQYNGLKIKKRDYTQKYIIIGTMLLYVAFSILAYLYLPEEKNESGIIIVFSMLLSFLLEMFVSAILFRKNKIKAKMEKIFSLIIFMGIMYSSMVFLDKILSSILWIVVFIIISMAIVKSTSRMAVSKEWPEKSDKTFLEVIFDAIKKPEHWVMIAVIAWPIILI